MSGEMRLRLVIDGETQAAAVAVNQVTTAISKMETTAKATAPAVTSALKQVSQGAADATKLTAQQLGQMQFQLQDIAVGLTSGQSPFTVMMQQGSQLAGMFQSGTGVVGALRAVGQGIVQFVTNPLNLAILGFGVAASAASAFFTAVTSEAHGTEDAMTRHEDLVKRIKDAYDETTEAVKAYASETRSAMLADALRNQFDLAKQMRTQTSGLVTEGRAGIMIGGIGVPRGGDPLTQDIAEAVQTLRQGIREGTPDIRAFVEQLARIEIAAGPESSAGQLARRIRDANQELFDLSSDYRQANDIVKALRDGNKGLNEALGEGTRKVSDFARAIGSIPETVGGYGPRSPYAGAPSPYEGKGFLDLLGTAEGTDRGRGYNETLGYGKFTGGPVDLVTMKLSEVLDLQKRMLADPSNTFNSSAVGRYQITAETLRDFMPKLGLTGDTIFSPEVQDKIALAIANAAGRNVDALKGRWEGLKFIGQGTILNAFDGASTDRSATAAEQERARLAKETADEKERELEIHKAIAEQTKKQTEEQRKANQAAADMQRSMIAFTDQFRGLTDGLASTIAQARESGLSWTKSMAAGLDMLKDKALNFLDSFIDKAMDAALFGPKGTAGGGLLGGILGSIGGLFNPMQNALGNAFQGGSVVAFASGGVFDQPTLFPMSQGRTGMLGEAGPEAILPLSRTASGHLGVKAAGAAGSAVFNMQINNRAGAEVTSSAQPNGSGGLDIELFIERKVEQVLGKEDTMRGLAGRLNLRNPTKQWGRGY